jgi:hypothetical protein
VVAIASAWPSAFDHDDNQSDLLVCRHYMNVSTWALQPGRRRNAEQVSGDPFVAHRKTYRQIDPAFWHADSLTCLICSGCL